MYICVSVINKELKLSLQVVNWGGGPIIAVLYGSQKQVHLLRQQVLLSDIKQHNVTYHIIYKHKVLLLLLLLVRLITRISQPAE